MPRSSRTRWLVGAGLVVALIATACSSSKGSNASAPSNPGGSGSGSTASSGTSGIGAGNGNPAKWTSAAVGPVQTITWGADQEPTGCNINTSKDNGTAVQNVIDRVWPSLIHVLPDFTYEWDLNILASPPKTVSTNPLTIELDFNKSAVWADGTPFGAADIIEFWNLQKDPANTKDPVSGKPIDDATDGTGFNDIASITGSSDGSSATLVFSQKFGDWPGLFVSIPPAHEINKVGWNDGFDSCDPSVTLSAGPYAISQWSHGQFLTLAANPKWWGHKPSAAQITYRFLPNSDSQVPALQNGEVNLIYPQPQTDLITQVKQIGSSVKSELSEGLSFEHLDFNWKDPILSDVQVRKAIATSIDRNQLIAATVGQVDPRITVLNDRMFVNNQPQYQDNSGGAYTKGDPAKAKSILQAAGWTLGNDGIFTKDGKRLTLAIRTTSGNALRESEEQVIQSDAKKAGIEITINNESSKLLLPDLSKGNFQLSLFAWTATPFPYGNNPIYTTGAGSNFGAISDPQADAILAKASQETDPKAEAADYNQADARMWAVMATLPLFQKPTYIAYSSNLGNIHDNPSLEGPSWNSEYWGKLTSSS